MSSVTELAPPTGEPTSLDPFYDTIRTRFTVEEFAAEAARLYPVLPLYRLNGDLRVAVQPGGLRGRHRLGAHR